MSPPVQGLKAWLSNTLSVCQLIEFGLRVDDRINVQDAHNSIIPADLTNVLPHILVHPGDLLVDNVKARVTVLKLWLMLLLLLFHGKSRHPMIYKTSRKNYGEGWYNDSSILCSNVAD